MGDTEKEADPVGGSGGTEDGGVEGWRGGCGRSRLGCGQIENVPTVKEPDKHKDTIYRTVAIKYNFKVFNI